MPSITLDEAIGKQDRAAVQIAGAVGLHPSFLSRIRRGRRRAPPEICPLPDRDLNASLDFDAPPPRPAPDGDRGQRPARPIITPRRAFRNRRTTLWQLSRRWPRCRCSGGGCRDRSGSACDNHGSGAGRNRCLVLLLRSLPPRSLPGRPVPGTPRARKPTQPARTRSGYCYRMVATAGIS